MSLLRRYNKVFAAAVILFTLLEVFGYIVLRRELAYLSDTTIGVSEEYRSLARLTKALLKGEKGAVIQKDAWISAWKAYDKGVSELASERYQLLLTKVIRERRDTILLFWHSSEKSFKSAVEKINSAFPNKTNLPRSAGIFYLLDKAKLEGDRSTIILLSELVSSLISFNVFAKEVMQIELLQLDRDINQHIERMKYYFWLQLSVVLFCFFLSSIVLLFIRDDPGIHRRKRLKKIKKTPQIKRKPPRVLNHE
mgnify:CR=1 FL=1